MKKNLKILVIGNGGREHALAWVLSHDADVKQVYAAPGNPGIAKNAEIVPIKTDEFDKLTSFVQHEKIDLTVVGPEAPLEAGIVDVFHKNKLRVFGPNRNAARIEWSKSFAKKICFEHNIPIPQWESFTEPMDALPALDRFGPPWVVKADGLAAGKGTVVTMDRNEAENAVRRELNNHRPKGKVVIEQFIDGWEASFLVTVSENHIQWLMPIFQDYKTIHDADTGPNTGGMGVYTPVQGMTETIIDNVKTRILTPFVKTLPGYGINFQGVIYLNAIIPFKSNDPYVLEFNTRFGDPEAQGIAPLVKNGLAQHLYGIADNSDRLSAPETMDQASVVVVLASRGYPTDPTIGDKVTMKTFPKNPNVKIFHAGTGKNSNGELVTNGGRVLNVAAIADDVDSARELAYNVVKDSIYFNGMQYRTDIGLPRTRKTT